ncbi:MAG: DJ-1/PfpI family protein [Patescibacteria group bacterium]
MTSMVLFVVPPESFRDEELFETEKVIKEAGIETELASTKVGTITGSQGGTCQAEKDLFEIDVADYQAIVFIGGEGAQFYFEDPIALAIAEEANRQGKVLAAICIAPTILANAGVLNGKKATAFPSEKETLESVGALYIDQPVVSDGNIITASGPQSASAFGWTIAELLKMTQVPPIESQPTDET